jgi:hydroxymethylpyrimidine pyrophosphatase-like HAD family hydrolase
VRYLALAADYDGTLAEQGAVRAQTIAALERLRKSGRRTLLVTGRELNDLRSVFDRLDLFDLVVAENGAFLYDPRARTERLLAEPPPPELARGLAARGATPLSTGKVIVATREPHQTDAMEVVRQLGLEWQVIFNKGAVMLLPSGVNKQTGLAHALDALGLSMRNTVAVGDAENDHAMLAAAECGVAVANALDGLKDRADLVLRGARGAGVEELIGRMLDDDLRSVVIARHALLVGKRRDGTELRIAPSGRRVLVAGPAGGAGDAASSLIERLMGAGYQCCVVDPNGDYEGFEGFAGAGTAQRPPSIEQVLELLAQPRVHVAANLSGVPPAGRPAFFASLLPRLQELRARTGRPHWIVIDDAHHLFPAGWRPAPMTLPRDLGGVLLVTPHSDRVAKAMIDALDLALAVGPEPEVTLRPFGAIPWTQMQEGEVLAWSNGQTEPLRLIPGRAQQRRQRPKHAGGDPRDEAPTLPE